MIDQIHWLGHDAFRIDGPKTIYIDPYQIGKDHPKGDLILITHDHSDHCSPEDVERIQSEDTVIVTIEAVAEMLSGNIQVVEPGDTVRIQGIGVEAVPAYNVNKFRSPGSPSIPKRRVTWVS